MSLRHGHARRGHRHPLDRIDSDGNYEPGNCRWARYEAQNNHGRHVRPITWRGITLTLSQWSRRLGIPRERLRSRIRSGWSLDETMGG